MPVSAGMHGFSELIDSLAATDNKSERTALAFFSKQTQEAFQNTLMGLFKSVSFDRAELEGHLGLLLAFRLVWQTVPKVLFESVDPNYEQLATHGFQRVFGEQPPTQVRDQLALIFRRLKSGARGRRGVATLDLTSKRHKRLLDSQDGLCRVCQYRFKTGDLNSVDELDDDYLAEPYEPLEGELALSKYVRRPQLDHILPFYLGGDCEENWQILCGTCNAGKGEALSWILRKGWMPPVRISDVVSLTPAIRYAALCQYWQKTTHESTSGLLRLFSKDPWRLVTLENIEVRADLPSA